MRVCLRVCSCDERQSQIHLSVQVGRIWMVCSQVLTSAGQWVTGRLGGAEAVAVAAFGVDVELGWDF